MKKILTFSVLMLILSVGNPLFVQAQTWTEYETPAPATAIAVTETAIYIFATDCFYRFELPLPAPGFNLPYTSVLVPGNGLIKNAAVVDDIVFVLRENGDLLQNYEGQWSTIFTDIKNISVGENQLFAWSESTFYHFVQDSWSSFITPYPIMAMAFNGKYHLVFMEFYQKNIKPVVTDLDEEYGTADLFPSEACMSTNKYVIAGEAINGLAAFHEAQLNVFQVYTHVLSAGRINSVAASEDTIWAAGRLGSNGCLFDVSDLSSLKIVPETVWQIRANNKVVAAISEHKLYVRGNNYGSFGLPKLKTESKNSIKIISNPVVNGQLHLVSSENGEQQLMSLDGRLVMKLAISEGENNFNLPSFSTGVYILTPSGIKLMLK